MAETEKIGVAKASLITAIGRYSKIVLTVLVNAILARILSNEDYGVVVIVTVISTFFSTLSDMGLGPAIIQMKDLTRKEIDSIYSFSVYVSFVVTVLFFLCCFPIASFYGDRVYLKIGALLGVSLFFNALNMVPNGVLNREKKFRAISIRTVVVYAGSSVIAVVLALLGFKYYAIAAQIVLASIFQFLWNYITVRPSFTRINWRVIARIKSYSFYQMAFNVVNYFSRNLDSLLIGKFFGKAELGSYNKAYNLMLFPINNLTGVVSAVLHPILSDYQTQREVIYTKYLRVVKFLALAGIFIAPLCYLAADEIILILYGPGWGASIRCFQLMALAIIPQMINSSSGGIFLALGNPRLLFINSCINTCITIGAILLGVFWGGSITAVALFVALSFILHFLTAFFMLIRWGFGFSFLRFVLQMVPEMVILGIMILAVVGYGHFFPAHPFESGFAAAGSLAVKTFALGVTFLIAFFLTGEKRILY